jgi:2-dehydro-3-deoxy-D-arabinonate dehydratase
MHIYRLAAGVAVKESSQAPSRLLPGVSLDALFQASLSSEDLRRRIAADDKQRAVAEPSGECLPPIESQEVWAAGVTYFRSRSARMEESGAAGGESFYDRVYQAHRPELFFKAAPHRVRGQGQPLRLRTDSQWLVPEPELTLAFNSRGELIGLTIGNDLSSRDIEGENPLYLPQAKVWDGSAALGPSLYLTTEWPPKETTISMSIHRDQQQVFHGQTTLAEMKQSFENLREHLFRFNAFPYGCYLMTGTGVVPPADFTLRPGDEVAITIEPVGTLTNAIS